MDYFRPHPPSHDSARKETFKFKRDKFSKNAKDETMYDGSKGYGYGGAKPKNVKDVTTKYVKPTPGYGRTKPFTKQSKSVPHNDPNQNIPPDQRKKQDDVAAPAQTEDSAPKAPKPLMEIEADKFKDIAVPPPVDETEARYQSAATGLTVVTVTNEGGHVFSVADRERLARMFPNLVILNTYGKGDSLVLGVDTLPSQLHDVLEKITKEHKQWIVNLEEVSSQDPFSYFAGWKLIPQADKLGMFSLIVNLKMRGKTKMQEMEDKRSLMKMIKEFNILKTMQGEGEVMIQVGHVLEYIAVSGALRAEFAIERQHTWPIRPMGHHVNEETQEGDNQYFWIKVNCHYILISTITNFSYQL